MFLCSFVSASAVYTLVASCARRVYVRLGVLHPTVITINPTAIATAAARQDAVPVLQCGHAVWKNKDVRILEYGYI